MRIKSFSNSPLLLPPLSYKKSFACFVEGVTNSLIDSSSVELLPRKFDVGGWGKGIASLSVYELEPQNSMYPLKKAEENEQ